MLENAIDYRNCDYFEDLQLSFPVAFSASLRRALILRSVITVENAESSQTYLDTGFNCAFGIQQLNFQTDFQYHKGVFDMYTYQVLLSTSGQSLLFLRSITGPDWELRVYHEDTISGNLQIVNELTLHEKDLPLPLYSTYRLSGLFCFNTEFPVLAFGLSKATVLWHFTEPSKTLQCLDAADCVQLIV